MSTPGRITKLQVNIDKCETLITYVDASTRMLCHNPTGFVFHSISTPCGDCVGEFSQLDEAATFMDHHFGHNGSIDLPLTALEQVRQIWPLQQSPVCMQWPPDVAHPGNAVRAIPQLVPPPVAVEQKAALHICQVMAMPSPFAQWALVVARRTDRLKVFNRAWHLQSCAWRTDNFEDQPKCKCHKIKQTMDCINKLVSPTLLLSKGGSATKSADWGETMRSVNLNLKILNRLLVQQTNLNKIRNGQEL